MPNFVIITTHTCLINHNQKIKNPGGLHDKH